MKKLLAILPLLLTLPSCDTQKHCCPIGPQQNNGTASEVPLDSDQRAQSDLHIDFKRTRVTEQKDHFLLEAVVATTADDDAQQVELILNLPVEIEQSSFNAYVQSTSNRVRKKIECQQCGHLVKCKLERLAKSTSEEIFFTANIGKPRFNDVTATVGLTAISHFPADPNPANNSFYWRHDLPN